MKVLLTGANGYIGRRLLPVLIEKGCEVYCLVRNKNRLNVSDHIREKIQVIEADLLLRLDVNKLPKDFDVAFYLVHSMSSMNKNFDKMEEIAARNFVNFVNKTSAVQIIYLGGIYNDSNLSKHLASRYNVEKILFTAKKSVTVLRAGIIVGSGSASFETIRDLVEKLPFLVAPRWVKNRTQPIAIRNVIDYLSGCMLNEKTYDEVFDIGGPDILTYKEMLMQYAEVRCYNRHIVTIPFLTPRFSSYWLYFITTTSYPLARNLVDSMKNEVVVKNEGIQDLIPLELLDYKTAVRLAFDKIQQNMVVSSWTDALVSGLVNKEVFKYIEIPDFGCYSDKKQKEFTRKPEEVLDNIMAIGGDRGWYSPKILWRMRGAMDRLFGGVGLNRGRKNATQVNNGDAVDFWRVLLADREQRRLILYAEMKLPG